MNATSRDFEAYLQARQADFVAELAEFLSIPSVSAAPEHFGDVERAAAWVAERLKKAGLEHAEVLHAGRYPMVYADWLKVPGAPTVLIYGHFDVQPADPVEAWTRPPFAPTVVGGRIYARGASDDKGNMFAPILALEALLRTRGRLPVNVKLLFEGQEEILSPDLPVFVAEHRERLACDMAFSADGWQWSETEGDLRMGLRGICALEITVHGPKADLHSGVHGGAVANPIHALAALMAGLRDADGRVAVPDFYREVRALSEEERRLIAAVPFDEAKYRVQVGVEELAGETGFTPRERIGARPTLEINGISGGYVGAGVKTVLPSTASAKITCRLVPDQDPAVIAARVRDHLVKQAPRGVRVEVEILPNAGHPYLIPMDHPANRAARDVLVELYGREPYYTRSGGSIPILDLFRRELGVYTVVFGFGLPDENFHGPDEFLRLSSFRLGQLAYGLLIDRIAEISASA
ncbi:dipeptidase [Chelatococcus sp. GCM10030263]|uniref:dipeptidase n=1 Tax=Chelatococcus sp. GCM10030263 TaxID=3273387 RepID=UPI00360DBB1C